MTNIAALMKERAELKMANTTLNQRVRMNDDKIAQLDHQINEFLLDVGLDSVKKDGFTAKRDAKIGIKVHDWDAVWAYILANKATHFLRRQLLQDPIAEMFDANEQLPGAEIYRYHKVSVKKTG